MVVKEMGDRGTAVRELGANRVVARVEARLEVKAAGDHKMDTKNTTVRAQA